MPERAWLSQMNPRSEHTSLLFSRAFGWRADEGVRSARRAVRVVPSPERPLLALDEQDALAHEDEEVLLLIRLVVVQAGRLCRRDDAECEPRERPFVGLEVGSTLQEDAVGLEDADAAEVVVRHPRGF